MLVFIEVPKVGKKRVQVISPNDDTRHSKSSLESACFSGPCNPRLGIGVSTIAWEGLRERPVHPLAGGRTKVRGGTQKFGPSLGEPETYWDNLVPLQRL